jgi:hypothetical protein
MITGDIAGISILNISWRMRKNIPDALASTVFLDGSLNLIARGRGTPDKVWWKPAIVALITPRAQSSN